MCEWCLWDEGLSLDLFLVMADKGYLDFNLRVEPRLDFVYHFRPDETSSKGLCLCLSLVFLTRSETLTSGVKSSGGFIDPIY